MWFKIEIETRLDDRRADRIVSAASAERRNLPLVIAPRKAERILRQRRMVQGDPHPVAKFRVIGPLSNSPIFAKAFGCKAGDAMVRAEDQRCTVW